MAGLAPLLMSSRTYSAMASNGLGKVAVKSEGSISSKISYKDDVQAVYLHSVILLPAACYL